MKMFRDIVEAEVTTKEGRALVLTTMDRSPTMNNLAMSYEKIDEIDVTTVPGGRLDIEITNYVKCTHFVKEHTFVNIDYPAVSLEFMVPIVSTMSFYPTDSDEVIKNKSDITSAKLSLATVSYATIDGKPLKIDKNTQGKLVKSFRKAKIKPLSVKDFAKKERVINGEGVIQYPEVKKAFDKVKKAHIKDELARTKKEDETKFKALKVIAKKEKVDKSMIALGTNKGTNKYVIIKSGTINADTISNLISAFKENSWAAEGNYQAEEDNNKKVIEALKKLSITGIFVYHTGPKAHEVRVDI